MKKILIIGAGQLGSRHLQSLNSLEQELDITVIDTNAESLEVAKLRFEATIKSVIHKVTYQHHLTGNQVIDVAIVASTAHSRRNIVENLLKTNQVEHLVLEKLLFTQEQDYFDVAQILEEKQTKTWVNCTMRMMPYYHDLKSIFKNQIIQYHVTGSQFGLVTNAIHYLDHLTHITGDHQFVLDTLYLDKHVIESKRAGYYELTGTLLARFANGSLASLHCDKAGVAPVQIEINSNEHRIISREWEQKAWQTSKENNWLWEEVNADIPFQSSLTAEFVNDLLTTKQCKLTDYASSMQTHLQLLNPLKLFLIEAGLKNQVNYPFT